MTQSLRVEREVVWKPTFPVGKTIKQKNQNKAHGQQVRVLVPMIISMSIMMLRLHHVTAQVTPLYHQH